MEQLAITVAFWFAAWTLTKALPGNHGNGLTTMRSELHRASHLAFGLCVFSKIVALALQQPIWGVLGGSAAWLVHQRFLSSTHPAWSRLRWLGFGAMFLAAAALEITRGSAGMVVFGAAVFVRHTIIVRNRLLGELGNLAAVQEKLIALRAERSGAAPTRDNSPKAS